MGYIERYEAFLKETGVNFVRIGDVLFREYNQIIIPLGPIIRNKPQYDIQPKRVFKSLKGKLIWWSYYDEASPLANWYGVIKEHHLEITGYPSSNTRNQIRKGLKNFEIRQISAELLIKVGYSIYSSVLTSKNQSPLSRMDYINNIKSSLGFNDVIQYWGVFKNNQLMGYAVVYCYDNHEANISEVRIKREYNKQYASYALFHILSYEYLKIRGFNYISDGYKNLLHTSNIQNLLIKKFGFKKVYLQLKIKFKKPYGVLKLFHPILRHFPYCPKPVRAVLQLIEASKKKTAKI